jgi:hypothetical protein
MFFFRWGVKYLTGENLEVVWAKFPTFKFGRIHLLHNFCSRQTTTSRVKNSSQVSSCQLKYVHALTFNYSLWPFKSEMVTSNLTFYSFSHRYGKFCILYQTNRSLIPPWFGAWTNLS